MICRHALTFLDVSPDASHMHLHSRVYVRVAFGSRLDMRVGIVGIAVLVVGRYMTAG